MTRGNMKAHTGKQLVASRRSLAGKRAHREAWKQAHLEELPLRYRLYCRDGAYNIRAGRLSLIEEIKEAKPLRIERLPLVGERHVIANPNPLVLGLLEVGE